jgi:hypothetical protein
MVSGGVSRVLDLDLTKFLEKGCVRMWDPAKAVDDSENGKILAEVNYDVSQFSVGDPFAEEHRLVV